MTYVTLRRPARNLFQFHNEMGQMFNDLFASPNEPTDETVNLWSPSVDIAETDNGFEVRAELPGVKQEDVNVSVRDNVLTLRGEKRQEETDEGKNYRRVERHYGTFQRAFTLPPNVDAEAITAAYRDGVLTLTVPKAEEAKPKEIPIEVNA